MEQIGKNSFVHVLQAHLGCIGFDFLPGVFLKLYQAVVTKRHSKCTRKEHVGAFQRVLYANRDNTNCFFRKSPSFALMLFCSEMDMG
jgi:hypothetical protein